MDFAFRQAVTQARRHGKLYFASLLAEDHIHQAFGHARWVWQGWIYTPAITIWVFLAQCLSASKTCTAAVARVIVLVAATGGEPPSAKGGHKTDKTCVFLGELDPFRQFSWLAEGGVLRRQKRLTY